MNAWNPPVQRAIVANDCPEEWGQAECNVAFDVVWGTLLGKPKERSALQVRLEHTNQVFTPPLDIADESWRAMFWVFDDAASTERPLYFKRLGRVRSYQADERTLLLTLEHTFYAHFLATNLNLQLPLDGDPHPIKQRIEKLASDRLSRQPFLASPLNVLAGVVSSDGFLFAPRRGNHLKERPDKLQTSVGGFWEWGDKSDPLTTLQREAEEELGLLVEQQEVEFVAFGFNGYTGEPDLLAVVRSQRSRDEIRNAWLEKTGGHSPPAEVSLALERDALELRLFDPCEDSLVKFIKRWRYKDDWSQPSDRASVLATLSRFVDHDLLKAAFIQSVGKP